LLLTSIVAVYDAGATSPDELSIQEGERATLVGKGMDYGDGWAQAEIEGRGRGLLPASYVSLHDEHYRVEILTAVAQIQVQLV
jgi:hypothetical protein